MFSELSIGSEMSIEDILAEPEMSKEEILALTHFTACELYCQERIPVSIE